METKFQTSFIPRKPLIPQENVRVHTHTSLLMVIGTFVFIVSVAVAGLTFAAKALLLKAQDQAKVSLAENEKRFNIPLIEELKKANLKIDFANNLLKSHVAASEVFAIIEGLTAEKIRFSSFDFAAADASATGAAGTSVFKVKMKGIADTFNSVAFQSDVMGQSNKYGTKKMFKNPVLSDLTVDANGAINFSFAADVALSDISYEKSLSEALGSSQ